MTRSVWRCSNNGCNHSSLSMLKYVKNLLEVKVGSMCTFSKANTHLLSPCFLCSSSALLESVVCFAPHKLLWRLYHSEIKMMSSGPLAAFNSRTEILKRLVGIFVNISEVCFWRRLHVHQRRIIYEICVQPGSVFTVSVPLWCFSRQLDMISGIIHKRQTENLQEIYSLRWNIDGV